MSAKALLHKQNADGSIEQIYLGHEANVALRTLQMCFADPASVDALFALGDLAWLGTSVADCDSYASRGDSNTQAKTYNSMQDLVAKCYPEGYNFFYINNTWLVCYFVKTPEGSFAIDSANMQAVY